jgi:hypothetical protein
MNHQPFEDWLFSEEMLGPDQSKALESHLNQCEQCNRSLIALNEVLEVISTSRTPEPVPGFTQRWYQHLVEYRQKQREKQNWFLIIGLLGLASTILFTLFVFNLSNSNWDYHLGHLIGNISLIAIRSRKFLYFAKSMTNTFPVLIPIIFTFGMGFISAMIALVTTWFSSIIRLYQPVRGGGPVR